MAGSYVRTEAHKKALSERINEWKPWEKSSGPVSPEGKKHSAKNSLKHGNRSRKAENDRAKRTQLLRNARKALEALGL